MAAAPLPPDEKARLEYLEALAILDTAPEPAFDRLVQLAKHLTGTPIAAVSLIAEHRQWFKARVGLDAPETQRENAFCSHTILDDRVMVVPDATEDERFVDNPLVTGAPGIRFYAGAPLVTPAGKIGALCVIDTDARVGLTGEQESALRLLAAAVVDALHQRVEARRAERTMRWLRLAEGLAKIGHWRVLQKDGSLFWSPEIFEIYGLDPTTQPTVEMAIAAYHPDDRERVSTTLMDAISSGESFEFDLRLFRSDGAIRWVRSAGRPEVDPVTGEVVSVFGVFQDVTEQKLMQSEMLHSERLDSLALMAATMAHEINNPLTSMQLNAELIGRLAAEPEPDTARIETMAADVLDGVGRIRKVTQELRAITRPSRPALDAVGLRRAVDAALRLSRLRLDGVGVSIELSEPVPKVRANEPRLVQVLINLLLNASHAFEGVPESQRRVVIRSGAIGANHAFLEIQDTGMGISEEVLQRVFEPFYTTKSAEQGTGLGLYVCREIIRSFGGSIEIDSSLGMGTTVRLVLRSEGATPVEKNPPGTGPRPRLGSHEALRLLVIDDDVMIGRALGRALRGYAVDVYEDPREALDHLLASGGRYAAILCDLAMPNLSGPALHAAAIAERPELDERFLFITGGTQSSEGSRFVQQNRYRVHLKPLHFQSLLDAIHAITDSPVMEPEATPVVDG